MLKAIEVMKERLPKIKESAEEKKNMASRAILYEHIIDTYGRAYERPQGTFVSWNDLPVPSPIFFAMDVIPILPAHFAPMAVNLGKSRRLLDRAEQYGVPRDSCGFNRLDVGAALEGVMPKPDMGVAVTYCDTIIKAYDLMARAADVPLFYLDLPYHRHEEAVSYFAKQLQKLVQFISGITKQPLDPERLRETLVIAREGDEYIHKIMELRKTVPCAMSIKDGFRGQYMLFGAQGSELGLEYVKASYEELKEKVAQGKSICSQEKHRVLWMHNAPYYDFSLLDYIEDELDTAIVIDSNSLWMSSQGPYDPDNPYESIARRFLSVSIISDDASWADALVKYAKEFKIDGVIHFMHFGCRVYNGGCNLSKDVLMKELDIPYLQLHADSIDDSTYSPEQIRYRVESFIESL
ncbi:MAG: 2-hydroxyacyl-CoA dehydratase [Deltaproteobacteria bacterium]|nr:2-hydroxyacyl-CoA dehydratase [Deltaproteobacteria bacterium]